MARIEKYEALGNDYLVAELEELSDVPWMAAGGSKADSIGRAPLSGRVNGALREVGIRRMCDRDHGIGADGLLAPGIFPDGRFAVRIFNADGSEAEKSGNGVRIAAQFLWDQGFALADAITIETLGGRVICRHQSGGASVSACLGKASFQSSEIPVAGASREVLRESVRVDDRNWTMSACGLGNPHCVLFLETVSPEICRRYGPVWERHSLFPRGTNVQFARKLGRDEVEVEIWERGSGRTMSSGSSSAAVVAVGHRLGELDSACRVRMPGGILRVEVDGNFSVTIEGPVRHVARFEGDVAGWETTDDRSSS